MDQDDSTDAGTTETSPLGSTSGQQIGPYRLLRLLGEGGMGEVWEADQERPVRRKVALKLIKWGMDTKAVVARFEAERQALALMNHPNVAKVFDAGSTEQGRPYFAMELIKGESITKYCDRQRLSTQGRLQVFMQVCEGVQHAHQKGIIHRDIKPSNILVQIEGDKPVPKIIDFGVAKATEQRLTERTVFTELGQLIGTPEYMSPEQAEMTVQDIDTRTDVYSLGVLLYELLVGALPFDPGQLRQAGFDEIRRRIREEEPSKPSTRISTLGDASGESARNRRTDPGSLARQLRGDLDWITIKSLEKDRTRRYGSPSELAADIRRHLDHEPVQASPPSKAYRMGKFVRRHTVGVTFAATLTVLLVGFGVWMSVLYAREEALRQAAEQSRAEAQARTEELEVVTEFQASMLSGIDVEEMGRALYADLGERVRGALEADGVSPVEAKSALASFARTLRRANATDVAVGLVDEHVLSRAIGAIESEFADKPLVRAALQQTVADTYREFGLYPAALPLQEAALDIRRRVLGDDHSLTLDSINRTGLLLGSMGKLDEGLIYHREALEGMRRTLGNDHPRTLGALNNVGLLLMELGELDEALSCHREALEGKRRVLGDDDEQTLITINNMGLVLKAMGRLEEALDYHRQALEGHRRVHGNDHSGTLTTIDNLAALLGEMGELEQALGYHREALEGRRRVLGDGHPGTLSSMNNVSSALRSMGEFDEALVLSRDAVEGSRRVLGDDHPKTLGVILNMGYLLSRVGNFEGALASYREALEGFRHMLGDDHLDTLTAINNLGLLLWEMGELDEALACNRESLEGLRRLLGDDHPNTLSSVNNMGLLLKSMGRLDEALDHFREALEGRRRILGDDHPSTLVSIHNMGFVLHSMDTFEEALVYYDEALEGRRRALGSDHPRTLISLTMMGSLLFDLGRPEEAVALLAPAVPAARRSFTDDNAGGMGTLLTALGRSRAASGAFRAAETDLNEAYTIFRETPASSKGQLARVMKGLGELYEGWHAAEPDAGHERKAAEWQAELDGLEAATQPAVERQLVSECR